MDIDRKTRLMDELDDETKPVVMRLFLERRALHEFSKLVEAGLEEGRILIPARGKPRVQDDDDDDQ